MCAIWVGLVAACWGAERPEKQQFNPPLLRKPGKFHIGRTGDRFEPYRWSAIRVSLVYDNTAGGKPCKTIGIDPSADDTPTGMVDPPVSHETRAGPHRYVILQICRFITGLTLGGLRFIIYIFIFLRPAPKTQSTHERALELVSGADF